MGISEIVDVQITRQTTAPTQAGFGTMLFLTDTVPVAFTDRVREYTEASQLIDDGFTTGHAAYKAAQLYFGQAVKPEKIKIGRKDVGDSDFAATITAIRNEDDDWYALAAYTHLKADILALAAIIETLPKIYAYCTDDADVLTGATDDVASSLKALNYDRTFGLYSDDGEEKFGECGWLGLLLPEQPGSVTWKFKTIAGIAADSLTPTQKSAAEGKNINVYTTIAGVSITEEGIVASGEFIDVMHGVDWMTARIQENVYGALVNLPKVPYTDKGAAVIESKIREILIKAVGYGILAESPEFTVTVPLVSTVLMADRANRLLPDVVFNGTLAGAIHKTVIRGTVSV